MNKKILIDGAFKEEIRVAIIENNVLVDYDREDFNFKRLKGNVYLERVKKIEPSLQAAFIDYGGEKHGFLPFSDIHPDYYNISKTGIESIKEVNFLKDKKNETNEVLYENVENDNEFDNFEDPHENDIVRTNNYSLDEEINLNIRDDYKQYKIEDVIKENQYLLVQVVKEERGNKGVSLTTYISLAGKYSVLMVNTPNCGGVSKKITNQLDRKILKDILNSLHVNTDLSIILRTASVGRKPEEILKDYLYVKNLWNAIKQTTFNSNSPTFLHSDDDIIKRTIRDLLNDSIDEIIVEGNDIYKKTKYLLDSIFKNQVALKLHTEKVPLFFKYNIEEQLLSLFNNKVLLHSGGNIVIEQTEALTTIDVNSAKATKEKNIEDMAISTNLEAAEEIARQLKLRDIGGLVVIDYIDMFELKNRRLLEKKMYDVMLNDRARVQIERLSSFGLMEVSRQRLRASFLERTSEICPKCNGNGKIKSREIVALNILRTIKYASLDKERRVIIIETNTDLYTFILNFKKKELLQIEENYNINIFFKENNEIEDNNFIIKSRMNLTSDEKKILDPANKFGKVETEFSESELKSVDENEIKNYKFTNINNSINQKTKKSNYINYYNNNLSSKTNQQKSKINVICDFFKKIIGL